MAVLTRLLLALASLGVFGASQATTTPTESELRAALAYKLMLFVEWPAGEPDGTARRLLCVVTEDPDTGRAFAALAGQTVKGRLLAVQRRAPLADLGQCDAVYFDRLEPGLLADKLAGLAGRPVLTFATAPARDAPAMIGLVVDRRRLAFDVRQPALRAAGLGLDARVMQLAREVVR